MLKNDYYTIPIDKNIFLKINGHILKNLVQ